MTLKMTTAQVIETSVTVTNSSFQTYTHPDDHTTRTTDTPGFKSFTIQQNKYNFGTPSINNQFAWVEGQIVGLII